MTVFLDPLLDSPARAVQLLACRSPHDPWRTLPVQQPVHVEAQKGQAAFHAGMKAAESDDPSLFRRDFKVELLPPLRQHPVEPFRILPETTGAATVIRLATDHGFPSAVLFHNFLEP